MDIYNCLNCKKELVKARNTRKFCSDKCRVYYHRHLNVTDSVTGLKVKDIREAIKTLNSATISVTEELRYAKEE